MKATIVSTDAIVDVDAIEEFPAETGQASPTTCRIKARVWEGVSEKGVRFVAYIPIVQTDGKVLNPEFERDLKADVHQKPSEWAQRAIDMRFFVD